MNMQRTAIALIAPLLLAATGSAGANVLYSVNVDTSAISGAGGYAIAFSFQDGEGIGDANNTVTLTGFSFGGGSAAGGAVSSGGVSGSLGGGVTITDNSFSSLFVEGFTPGTSLSFTLDLTTNVDAGGTPDFFGFALLRNGNAVQTLDDTLGDNLLYFNIDSANPAPSPWATVPGAAPVIAAPTVQPAAPPPPGHAPEPATLALLGLGTLLLVRRVRAQAS
jgi:hypothetical protein